MLTNEDKRNLIKRLPNIELCYENVIHNKVRADYYMVIPKGIKVLVWFTYYKNNNICLFLSIKNDRITSIEAKCVCFSSDIAYNTILYGTLFKYKNNEFFTCEDILYYNNNYVYNESYDNKFSKMQYILDNYLKQKVYSKNFVAIGLPIICDDFNSIHSLCNTLFYDIYCIGFIKNHKSDKLGNYIFKNKTTQYANFIVTADINADTYNLHYYDRYSSEEVFYDIASIQDYKTSVMMNKVFRNIKENYNLDLLEESDDEEEFENIDEFKYVDINKKFNIKCEYMPKFKKWKPIEILNHKCNIVSKNQLQNF